MALVNYSDEYLTHSSSAKQSSNVHERIGGVLLASTLLTSIGIILCFIISSTIFLPEKIILIAALSSIPMIITWIGYFYLFQFYSAHQVLPLFGISSLWLLLMEITIGNEIISLISLIGILLLVFGAYYLDSGSFKWKIPTSLLIAMLPISLCWALTLYFWRIIESDVEATQIYFWHLLGIFFSSLVLLCIRPYRHGFITRIKNEKGKFILHSALNEGLSQTAFFFSILAVTAAPLAAYVAASEGIKSIIILGLFYIFPLDKRNTINKTQTVGIILIASGIAFIEI